MRVLIATDGSPASRIVQEEVAARPWPLGTEVLVLRCVSAVANPAAPSLVPFALKSVREELQESVKGLYECAGLDVSTLVVEGHPAKTIVMQAEAWGADFIFMGSRGSRPVGRFLLGSTVTEVLHHAPCAVEIVRDWQWDRTPRSDGSRRILLATDGSACSEKAVESVAARFWVSGSEFRIISVPVFAVPPMESGYLDADAWAEIRDRAVDHANRAARTRFKETSVAVDAVVPSGLDGPKACILDEAGRWQADLIVAGSHGLGRLDRFLLGSVSETLALYAPCSVEVFRDKHIHVTKDDHSAEVTYISVVQLAGGDA
jgi:nucleotide-binding universal stress UspA family protein